MSGDTSILSSTMNSRIFLSFGTVAGVSSISNLFQPWRVLLMPTVHTSTARARDVDTRAASAAAISVLERDLTVIIAVSTPTEWAQVTARPTGLSRPSLARAGQHRLHKGLARRRRAHGAPARRSPPQTSRNRSMAALRPDERAMLGLLSKRTRPKRGARARLATKAAATGSVARS